MDFRKRNEVFEEMVAYNGMGPVLTREGQPAERLLGMVVSGNFFRALGVAPALGRVFTDEEDQPNTNNVVVLSDRFWRTHFGADPRIVGRTIRLDGQSVQVIGVMPPAFEHPLLWFTVDLWRPDRVHAGAASEPRQQLPARVRAPEARGDDRRARNSRWPRSPANLFQQRRRRIRTRA